MPGAVAPGIVASSTYIEALCKGPLLIEAEGFSPSIDRHSRRVFGQ